jgi:pyruvate,water dikinase
VHYVTGLRELDRTSIDDAGAKAANLGELSRIVGINVPDGFCVTTHAFGQVVGPVIRERLERLAQVPADDRATICELSAGIRRRVEDILMPDEVVAEIGAALTRLGERTACAVRSSASAEDLPGASFAGQQDSYLNVVGVDAVLWHVRRCWASLFTERAVSYRQQHGFDHRTLRMAVLVQTMVLPDAAGVLFTADPVTSNRRICAVEAVRGLADALVSGRAAADTYIVRDGEILATAPAGDGPPVLSTAQVLRLTRLGRQIEAHFGAPQDVEWCLAGDQFQVVQSRPITTVFPVPDVDDGDNHVYVSVGHQQMMTDAMTPLGLSVWQHTTPRRMHEAGGRLFVDVAPIIATPAGRTALVDTLGRSDPLIRDALQTLLDRGDFIRLRPDDGGAGAVPTGDASDDIEADPSLVTDLIARHEQSLATLRREIPTLSGPALIEFILADFAELKRLLFDPRGHKMIMAGMRAAWWLNDHLERWLGEKNAADTLGQSVPDNVTAQMGLALLDVADAIRPHPEVVAYLRHAEQADLADGLLAGLTGLAGGEPAREAIEHFLDRYGMRCAGEIDITRTRWSERPVTLVPTILSNVATFEPGAAARRFEEGLERARRSAQDVLVRLRALPDGAGKAEQTARMIERVRAFAGYREYPKYGMVCRYFVYKQALLREAERLVRSGVLRKADDLFYLRLEELPDVVRSNSADHALIQERREAFRSYQALTPPRVLTSDGECVCSEYRRADAPPGALAGLAVSAGTVEGRARVVTDMARADLEPGDILVTAYTDPSWTPLFVAAAGLVTEVGGLMTHGAVIAREYGLPAVVGVQRATTLIRDGQRIRVNGTDGYVQVLP